MSRSVSYLNNATAVAYIDASDIEDNQEWAWFSNDLAGRLKDLFPSLENTSRWDDHETEIVLENRHCEIAFSEYCGLVSVSLRPLYNDDTDGLANHWCDQVKDKFLTIGDLVKIGTFSNGESIYKRKDRT